MLIKIREWESQTIDPGSEGWESLNRSREASSLIENNVIEIAYTGRGKLKINSRNHVGAAQMGNVELQIQPRIDGSLAALIQYASGSDFNVTQAGRESTDLGRLMELLVDQFLSLVSKYVSQGVEKQYGRRRERDTLGGGKLNVRDTIKLRAKGKGHVLSFAQNRLSSETDTNKLISLALADAESIQQAFHFSEQIRRQIRRLSLLFRGIRDHSLDRRKRSDVADMALKRSKETTSDLKRDMLGIAGAILSRSSFEKLPASGLRLPRSWFLNMSDLYETATRRVFGSSLEKEVYKETQNNPPIFSASSKYSANPDLVIGRPKPIIIGDMKYSKKAFTGGKIGTSSDVYQLLSHAHAYGVEKAFLAYAGPDFRIQKLGMSASGVEVDVFMLNPAALKDQVSKAIQILT